VSVGDKVPREDRGNLTRPTVAQVMNYRLYVSENMLRLLEASEKFPENLLKVLELVIHHENQHQELLLTDIKYILGHNPLFPVYDPDLNENPIEDFPREWISMKAGLYLIGQPSFKEFAYDNEKSQHKVYL